MLADSVGEAPLITAGHLGVHPVEAVAGVIEVKSAATPETVKDAVAKVASVKALIPDDERTVSILAPGRFGAGVTREKPFGAALCLGRRGDAERIFDAYADANDALPKPNRTNALVVVDEFVAVWVSGDLHTAPMYEVSALGGTGLARVDAGANALLVFYIVLREALRQYQAPPLSLMEYVNAAGGIGEHELVVQPMAE